ncbi:MAG: DUF4199 domain-containing protein [Flavobacteriales bacterium]|nr:MAG: DUF4199 domain-containing protein [Flavobacteriales bacterium]
MENQTKSSNNIAVNYGVYLGMASVIISLIIYAMGKTYEQNWIITLINILTIVVFVILGIKKFKENNNGYLVLSQGLKTGIAVALIGAIIGIIYILIFVNFIEPGYTENVLEISRQKMMENPNLSEEQIDNAIEIQKNFSSPWFIAAVGLLWSLFIGFITSLIASLVMQQKPELS